MFRFAHPVFLYALGLVPFLVFLFWLSLRLKKKALKQFGDYNIIAQLMPDVSNARTILKFILTLLALIVLIFTISGPQFGSKLREEKRKGIEIIIAIDVSNSMLAQDIQPNRLERAKQAVSKMVDKLQNDKIGLVVFAGKAYTQLPITTDYVSAKMFLSSINTNIVAVQGTDIGAAIDLAAKSFGPQEDMKKVIVILTDGENHEDAPVEAASKAAEKGIIIHTIGIGLPQGAPIPVSENVNQQNFRKDNSGSVIISRLDETTLQQIASAGKGEYIRNNNSQLGLDLLFDKINKLDKKEIDAKVYTDYDDQFQYLAIIALIILFIDTFILERKNKLLRRVQLFSKQ
jgi:Ca-activated chloride channel homolog